MPPDALEIDGAGLHFVHVRGQGSRRLPIVLTNGWPSCFIELLPLVPLLTRDEDGLSFDVVIPSLPGNGFSDRPRTSGTNITRIAELWTKLMTGLGYASSPTAATCAKASSSACAPITRSTSSAYTW